MMDTAMAFTNPVSTECETKRTRRPIRRSHATTRTAPVRIANIPRSAGSSGLSVIREMSDTITATAEVVSMLISAELVDNEPAIRPTR